MNCGIDVGYNFVKAKTANGREATFPSVVAPYVESTFSLQRQERRILTMGDHKYVVGEADSLSYQSGRRDARWIFSDMWRALLCTALGEIHHATGAVNLVTGLPLQHYRSLASVLKSELPKSYSFGLNGRPRQTITIQECMVITQPYGALLDVAMDDAGNVQNNRWATEMVAVAEIGGNTFNMLTTRALAEVPEWTEGDNFGLLDALGRMASDIAAVYPGIEPKAREVATWIANGNTFDYHGQSQSIEPFKDRHLTPLAELLAARFTENWREPGRLSGLLLAGGGAMVIGDILSARLGDEWPVVVCGDNRSVVNGYYKLARRLWG